jgi:hypothetical protein
MAQATKVRLRGSVVLLFVYPSVQCKRCPHSSHPKVAREAKVSYTHTHTADLLWLSITECVVNILKRCVCVALNLHTTIFEPKFELQAAIRAIRSEHLPGLDESRSKVSRRTAA